jgi:hypothetical protein
MIAARHGWAVRGMARRGMARQSKDRKAVATLPMSISGPLQCDRLARPACFRQCLGRARTLNPKEIC